MALATHAEDNYGNIVAEDSMTRCVCGCKYWEDDKCIDCGMTPERLWIIQHGERLRIMQKMSLNVAFTTMLHYELPWVQAHVSDDLDLLNIQQELADLPRYNLTWHNGTEV